MPDPVTVTIDGRTLVLTHLDKELFADGWTKHDLIEYYANAAPYMLPHLQGRPATLIRLPGGAGSEPFFAKTPPPGLPEWVPTVPVLGRDGPKDHVSVDARPTLIALANADAVEIHVPPWRHPHPD